MGISGLPLVPSSGTFGSDTVKSAEFMPLRGADFLRNVTSGPRRGVVFGSRLQVRVLATDCGRSLCRRQRCARRSCGLPPRPREANARPRHREGQDGPLQRAGKGDRMSKQTAGRRLQTVVKAAVVTARALCPRRRRHSRRDRSARSGKGQEREDQCRNRCPIAPELLTHRCPIARLSRRIAAQ